MNDLRKAAEMALEALCLTNNEIVPDDIEERREAAIEALRQALNVDAVNMSQERVDETAKGEHEPIGYIDGMHGGYMVFTPINPAAVYLNGTALYLAPPKKEWVGLDGEIPGLGLVTEEFYNGMLFAEDYLREKNGE